jgi:formylglycine-generating enzyme required for sulfatase activity
MRTLPALLLFTLLPILSTAQFEQDFELGDSGEYVTMVWIEPGSFPMGAFDLDPGTQEDEFPRHLVNIRHGFWVGKYEVTQSQWEAVMGEWDFWWEGSPNLPAEMLSYNDIHDDFLPSINSVEQGNPWRLPTEAEWEYFARGGNDSTRFSWGHDPGYFELKDHAWYWDNNSPNGTKPVGQKHANPWGLFDVIGNVWEFCEDWNGTDYYQYSPLNDPTGPYHGRTHVLRGGAWRSVERACRPSDRHKRLSHQIRYCTGLRLVFKQDTEIHDIEFSIVPANTIVPATGGTFGFTAWITNNTGTPRVGIGWTEIITPDGQIMGPLALESFEFGSNQVVLPHLYQAIPAYAPAGRYTFIARLSFGEPQNVVAYDSFEVIKLDSTLTGVDSPPAPILEDWKFSRVRAQR